MKPVFFDSCFGWFHPADGRRGVVLCGPLGEDTVRMHRSWRELAERLAAAGLPTLRFDYPGAGDSLGDAYAPGRADAWLASIHSAMTWLRERAGVETFTLIGFRFGASLAMAAAEQAGGVEGLALLAPASSGRAYRRELAMLAKLGQRGRAEGLPPEFEVDGIALTEETLASLERFDVTTGELRPASRVLILTREGVPPDRRLAERLRDRGVQVQEGEFFGYAPLLWQADFSKYPQDAFAQVIAWAAPGAPPTAPHAPCAGEVDIPVPGVRETATVFGQAPGLFGIICEPQAPIRNSPVLVFLNTGAISHVGSTRMWVSMARRLAQLGFASLRFDLAGVGDSPSRPDQQNPVEHVAQAVGDVRSALDWLERKGSARVVLIGFCWGAQLACNVSFADHRIAAQVLINPRRMFWTQEIPHHRVRTPAGYLNMLRDPAFWRKLLVGRIRRSVVVDAGQRLTRRLVADLRSLVLGAERPPEAAARRIRDLAARGVDTLMIFGDGDPQLEELEEFMGVPRAKLAELLAVKVRLLDGIDHLFQRKSERDQLAAIIAEHLGELRASPAPPEIMR